MYVIYSTCVCVCGWVVGVLVCVCEIVWMCVCVCVCVCDVGGAMPRQHLALISDLGISLSLSL